MGSEGESRSGTIAEHADLPDLRGREDRPFFPRDGAMPQPATQTEQKTARFTVRLQRMKTPDNDPPAAFVVLPPDASAILPRRGRTTVTGRINSHHFQRLLEPDGRKSHWMRLDSELMKVAEVAIGQEVSFEIEPVAEEPEPVVPDDLRTALEESAEARKTWEETTTLARVDWVHWIESAKRESTRRKRISDACEMLSSGKKRVCCFDPSGVYSKGMCAPESV